MVKLWQFGPLVLSLGDDQTRVGLLRALLEADMTALESENAQAARELASLDPTDDPEPGAFYGLPINPNEPEPETTPHA